METKDLRQFGIQIGESYTREELHDRILAAYIAEHGSGAGTGNWQSGIVVVQPMNLILLFSDRSVVDQTGYEVEGWIDDDEVAYDYTGQGTEGDQELTNRNLRLANAAADGIEVHLLISDTKVAGRATSLHRYAGPVRVMATRRERHPDRTGQSREILVFTLERLAIGSDSEAPDQPVAPLPEPLSKHRVRAPHAETTVEVVGGEDHKAYGELHRGQSQETVMTRAEAELEDRLRERLGLLSRQRITPKGESAPLYTDVFDPETHTLYELKSRSTRNAVRMAVGQLLDYRRYLTADVEHLVVVLPDDPGEDLSEFLHGLGIGLLFWSEETEEFIRRA